MLKNAQCFPVYQKETQLLLPKDTKLLAVRKIIAAVTHVDGSGRLQIIDEKQNARYYNIINKFGQKTGVYVLLNTSFNLKGEPIVNSPKDALNTFKTSGLDILALERYIIRKEDVKD